MSQQADKSCYIINDCYPQRARAAAGAVRGGGDAAVPAGGGVGPDEAAGAPHRGRRGQDAAGQVLQRAVPGQYQDQGTNNTNNNTSASRLESGVQTVYSQQWLSLGGQ